jgi:hypothetical protein
LLDRERPEVGFSRRDRNDRRPNLHLRLAKSDEWLSSSLAISANRLLVSENMRMRLKLWGISSGQFRFQPLPALRAPSGYNGLEVESPSDQFLPTISIPQSIIGKTAPCSENSP